MPTNASAFVSLLPLVGAAALTFQGIRRFRNGRAARRAAPAAPPPRPVEIPAVERPGPRRKAARPDVACPRCGTSMPAREKLCTPCERQIAGAANSAASTALHWLVLVAAMSAIIGGGWLLGP